MGFIFECHDGGDMGSMANVAVVVDISEIH